MNSFFTNNTVICKDASSYEDFLTYGKTYTILDISPSLDESKNEIMVIDDTGMRMFFEASIFKKVFNH